jgi:acyl-homoserine-lactone acylase
MTSPPPAGYRAEIIRTEGGIPHIYADDWGSLGFGTLYAMAEDNVCTLARQYLKFGARQSEFLGPDEGRLESDFFYQLLIDRGQANTALEPRLEQLFAGAAAGYNRYLADTPGQEIPDSDCRGAPWLLPTTSLELKRVSAVDYALDYMHAMIVAAQPPSATAVPEQAHRAGAMSALQLAAAVDAYMEVPKQGGSNAIAVGSDRAQAATSLLVANPHMSWKRPFQRFYAMHQVIPGEINMIGANLIGRPRVGFGAGEHLAWTSTVSTAKRHSFYRLKLVPGHPTRYLFDGKEMNMIAETVTVGGQNHTFYSTHFGALLVQSPFFRWSEENAFAVRLIEVGFRGENSAFEQYAAKTVRELKAVHNKYQFMTVNLIAADDSGEVMYTDPGPIPNITDQQLKDCGVLRGAALDGSRSSCMWGNSEGAAAEGILAPDQLPLLYRRDYVTNSNDSYWLANPQQPLEGFADIIGEERTERTLRTRSGLQMVQAEIVADGGIDQQELMDLTLANENFAGQIIRDDLVELCRDSGNPELQQACQVLANWDLHDNLDSRGAHLLRQILASANGREYNRRLPKSFTPRQAFTAEDPLHTPSGLAENNPEVLENLEKAVQQLQQAGIALDAKLGDIQHVTRNGVRIPIHGGPESAGVFNKIEADFQGAQGYPEISRWSSSWIMATRFGPQGPDAKGILAYSQSANPDSPHYRDQTGMFSNKQWLSLPFYREQVEAAGQKSYSISSGR